LTGNDGIISLQLTAKWSRWQAVQWVYRNLWFCARSTR